MCVCYFTDGDPYGICNQKAFGYRLSYSYDSGNLFCICKALVHLKTKPYHIMGMDIFFLPNLKNKNLNFQSSV